MRGGDDVDPLRHRDAPARDQVADLLVEDLRGGAGQGAQARLPQLRQVFADGKPRAHGAVQHFLGREGMDVHVGQGVLDGPREVDVVPAVELRGQPGLDADLGRPHIRRLLGAPDDLLDGQEVALLLAVVAAERTERAVLDAHVGEVDVAVHHVGDHLAHLAPAQLVGDQGYGVRVAALGARQGEGVVRGQLRAVQSTRRGCGARRAMPSRARCACYQRRQCSCDSFTRPSVVDERGHPRAAAARRGTPAGRCTRGRWRGARAG